MEKNSKVSYRRRVMRLSGVVSALFAILGVVAWFQLAEVQAQGSTVAEAAVAYTQVARVVDLADEFIEPAQDVVLFSDLSQVPFYTERYDQLQAELARLSESTADAATVAGLADAMRRFEQADEQISKAFDLVVQGKSMEAGALVGEASRVLDGAVPGLKQVHAKAFAALNSQLNAMERTTQSTMYEVLGACILVIVFNTLLTGMMSRQVLGAIDKNSRQIAASAQDLAQIGASIGNNADETFTQANAASAAAEEVSRHVQSVALAAEEMNSSVQEIAHSVHEVSRVANSAVAMADNTNQIMGKLAVSSKEIGALVRVIT
jgi:methyl-accepting chemotaxis protein